MKRDIDRSDGNWGGDSSDLSTEGLRQPDATTLHSEHNDIVNTTIAFDDFVCHPGHCPAHVVRP
jgi:hypothetical protein